VTFANGPQYGSGAVINPGARLDDGRLEIVVFDDPSLPAVLSAAPRLFLGGLEQCPAYRRVVADRARLTSESPVPVHRDGDPAEPVTLIELEVVPRALEVVVPLSTVQDPAGPFTADQLVGG